MEKLHDPACKACAEKPELTRRYNEGYNACDPNGWGATRCCKNLFHYRCLHAWLSDDSDVETSHGMEPINTACPCCRGFVPKSVSRMLG
ncbi:hypothetical protein EMIHUDRAFT_227873 [Emiliania huxleyi CCMP1516]|uniref:RING-type domain-containing protein n=2 Tax=Emiliania huxleyi TaxID=2903 RepID=A0A0D3KH66_EMIH1|nr:hypothetical protein EMIHUDRAFT_227873 [Emiliania huxleyi CCMP1516]EOD35101.1 hypothetical protein EMIHUDRAFT_227873 [Emiliania huxleyi CCMP1516]|eukprot:XP_005787530.1 hypothetical protein EMIHUDRAFT_227873 [Emiliania huxleyi CCMP1516]